MLYTLQNPQFTPVFETFTWPFCVKSYKTCDSKRLCWFFASRRIAAALQYILSLVDFVAAFLHTIFLRWQSLRWFFLFFFCTHDIKCCVLFILIFSSMMYKLYKYHLPILCSFNSKTVSVFRVCEYRVLGIFFFWSNCDDFHVPFHICSLSSPVYRVSAVLRYSIRFVTQFRMRMILSHTIYCWLLFTAIFCCHFSELLIMNYFEAKRN